MIFTIRPYSSMFDLRLSDLRVSTPVCYPKHKKLKGWQKNLKRAKKHR